MIRRKQAFQRSGSCRCHLGDEHGLVAQDSNGCTVRLDGLQVVVPMVIWSKRCDLYSSWKRSLNFACTVHVQEPGVQRRRFAQGGEWSQSEGLNNHRQCSTETITPEAPAPGSGQGPQSPCQ